MKNQTDISLCENGNGFPGCLKVWVRHIKNDHPFVIVVLCLFFILFFSLFLGGKISGGVSPKVVNAADIYVNVLSVTLSIIAIFVTILGYATYKSLEMKFEHLILEKTSEVINEHEFILLKKQEEMDMKNFYWLAKLNSDFSVGHYNLYEVDDQKRDNNLKLAINKIDKAYKYIDKLDMDMKENLKLKGEILNNYAYYLAVRGHDGDRKRVKKFVDFLESKLPSFPEIEDSLWRDTIDFARGNFLNLES